MYGAFILIHGIVPIGNKMNNVVEAHCYVPNHPIATPTTIILIYIYHHHQENTTTQCKLLELLPTTAIHYIILFIYLIIYITLHYYGILQLALYSFLLHTHTRTHAHTHACTHTHTPHKHTHTHTPITYHIQNTT